MTQTKFPFHTVTSLWYATIHQLICTSTKGLMIFHEKVLKIIMSPKNRRIVFVYMALVKYLPIFIMACHYKHWPIFYQCHLGENEN